MFDLLVTNIKVADGVTSSLQDVDIAVTNGMIAAIAPGIDPGRARQVIDGGGKVAAPGFIDVHSHSDYYLIIDNRAHGKLLQGVTTEIGGNCGYAAAPMEGEVYDIRSKDYHTQFGIDVAWRGLDEYFKALAAAKPAVNYVALIGYNTVRGSVMGFVDRAPTTDEMKQIRSMIGKALDDGAAGMSVGVVYPPACFSSEAELIEAYRVVAVRGKIFTTHMSCEGAGLLEALTEVTNVAKAAGTRLQVSHLKTAGKENWKKLDAAFAILDQAVADGVTIMADRYPYLASNTGLQVVLPDRAFDGGRVKLMARLADAEERARFQEEILKNHPEPEYWETVMISQVVTAKNRDLEGMTVAEGAVLRNVDPFNFIFDLLLDEQTNVEAIYFCMSQENMDRIYDQPYVVVGSDAGARSIDGPLATGRPHPRNFGSFPKFFKEYVREKGRYSIPQAIRKMSTDGAEFFNIPRRGKLIEGYHADIVIFDPETFGDTSTYQQPMSYPVGMEYVIVNGAIAVQEGRPTGIHAGVPLPL